MSVVHKAAVTASLGDLSVTKSSSFTMDSDYEGQVEGDHIVGQVVSRLTQDAIKELGVTIKVDYKTEEEITNA